MRSAMAGSWPASYFGEAVESNWRPDVFDRDGAAWLPIGCYLIRTSDRVVLIDVGLGPQRQQLPDGMELSGGDLLNGLAAAGTARTEITDVICTHLHSDHVGWLFDGNAQPVFPDATIWFGAADGEHFINGPGDGSTSERIPSPRQLVATSADEPRHGSGAGRYHGCHPWARPGTCVLKWTYANGVACSWATRLPIPCSSRNPPGTRSATLTPNSRNGRASGSGARWRSRA